MAEKIKIIFINEVSRIAGAETWFLSFVEGLDDPDIEPALLCPPGPFADAAGKSGITVQPYKFRLTDLSTCKLWRYPRFFLWRFIDCIRIGLSAKREKRVVVHSLNLTGHVISALMSRIFRIPSVWHIHDQKKQLLYRMFNPTHIIFVGHHRQRILKDTGLEGRRSHSIIYNGIDPSCFAVHREKQPGIHVGFIGRLIPVKGLDTLLGAAAIMKKKNHDVVFDIYGEEIYDDKIKGRYTDHIRRRITELGLENTVKLHGFVFPQQRIYSAIDIFLLPTHHKSESCPMTILESWAAGIPVITTNAGGIPDIVKDRENGFMIPMQNPAATADAIEYIIAHPEETGRIVENARKTLHEQFDNRVNARKFVELYRKLTDE